MRFVTFILLSGLLLGAVSCGSFVQPSQSNYAQVEQIVARMERFSPQRFSPAQREQAKESLAYLIDLIENRYYRPLELATIAKPAHASIDSLSDKPAEERHYQALLDSARKAIVQALDKNSSFYTAEEYSAFHQSLDGKFGGIGARVKLHRLGIEVEPLPEGPAAKAGMRIGDIIVRIGGYDVSDTSLSESVKKLRGKVGTNLSLSVQRPVPDAEAETLDFTLTRALVHHQPVTQRIEDGIGYVRISSFNDQTDDLVEAIIAQMERQDLRGYILDLRGNLGGLLQQAVTLSNYFLDDGLIVGVRGRHGDEVYSASSHTSLTQRPVIILQDRATASSSEILAAALSAHGRARLMGDTSYGKGTVQSLIGLHRGEGVRITIARYFSPNGIDIEGKGIAPDIALNDNPDTPKDELLDAAIAVMKTQASKTE